MKRKGILFLLCMICLFLFSSCGGNKYNAVMHSHPEEWISKEFLMENRVKAYYLNDEYIEGESDPSEKYIYDEESPFSRTFVIDREEEFNRIFTKYEEQISFEKEMVLLYIFSDTNPNREYSIKTIHLDNQNLTIYFKLQTGDKKDATAPYQRCLMVRMNKMEIEEVHFIEQ